MKIGIIISCMGTWLLSDAWYSLALYADKKESFLKCHLIRVIRGLIGIGLVVAGYRLNEKSVKERV